MRFSLNIGMCDPTHYGPMAQEAESAGYDSIAVPDSLTYPRQSETLYPYTDDGDRSFLEGEPFMETLIAVTHMAAVTEKIHFCSYVYKLAIRQAAVVAKQVQSIQALSGHRFEFGVGLSPWPEDYAVAGVPWEKRGKRLDEQIAILQGLETGEYFGLDGVCHSMPENKMCPVPATPTPIFIGGHSEAALKRAARVGDGWVCAGADTDEVAAYIQRINELRAENGTAETPFKFWTTGNDAFTREGIERLEAVGVTDVVIGFRDPFARQPDSSLEDKIRMLQWYASEFIR
ncbi:TIGR03619 family F420-dependent LLM class oxidoreductase [Parahaliea mediterranea]|uniref:TIGR03619 family F420-dependent LLM class oxidoreductase n=1 Tax=Parahaliea mediterranea TaxID=651086 RepID=A0A939DG89_9GAMM|nr:TIGR03619 family F420-dependent LLM class oxidoreductase [Parahaliea mediterranea]MBN7796972.1 TIGR03619 family F420-dependent LLM class oxidoreductase [Parahaliea mediterranea]